MVHIYILTERLNCSSLRLLQALLAGRISKRISVLPANLASMSVEPQGEVVKYGFKERVHRFYRGTLFQAIIIGLVSFTQPGIWTALNSKESHKLFHCILTNILRSRWWRRSKSYLRQSVQCHHLRVSMLLPRKPIKLIFSALWFSALLFAVSLVIWLE